LRTSLVLRIQRTTDRAAVVLTVCGRLDVENVGELCASLDAIRGDAAVVVDLTDLVLADRDVVRLLRAFVASGRIVLRNCPTYIRVWMEAEDIG
jgi:anti-anti-sigma regulatory factor